MAEQGPSSQADEQEENAQAGWGSEQPDLVDGVSVGSEEDDV